MSNSNTLGSGETSQDEVDPVGGAIIAGGFIFLLGLFIALVAFIPSNIDYRLVNNGDSVEGVVINIDEESGGRGASHEVSTISYTVDGKDYTIEEKQAMGKLNGFVPTEKGSKVTVYYNPDKPNKAVAEGWEKNGTTGYVAGGIGCALAVFIVASTVIKSKKDEKKTD